MRKRTFLSPLGGAVAVWLFGIGTGELPAPVRNPVPGVRAFRLAHENDILREFAAWLAIPNMCTDGPNIRRNAEHLAEALRRRNVDVQILETEGGPPVVFGEVRAPGATKTLLLYAHYDGQPVTPEGWKSDPWKPVLRDGPWNRAGKKSLSKWRRGRTTENGDSTPAGQATTRERSSPLWPPWTRWGRRRSRFSINLKFLFEGEEEIGSPHLGAFLDRHKTLLRADALLLCDGPVHQSRRMQIPFGARGITDLEITVFGPNRALHSGHYGNWAPNPASLLANLIASLRDSDGKILIPGIYDGIVPLSASEREAIDRAPRVDEALRRELALAGARGGTSGSRTASFSRR